MPEIEEDIGRNLRRMRISRRLTLEEVARQAGISEAALSRIETSKQRLDVTLLRKLAHILEVPASKILGEESPAGQREVREVALNRNRAERLQLHDRVNDLLETIELLQGELRKLSRNVDRKGSDR